MVFTKLRRTRARERSHTNESHRGRSRRETSRRTLSDENTHQNLHRLVTVTDGDVRGNLFVTADTERTDGVSRLGEDRLLTGELLQNLYSNARDAIRQSRGSLALERIRPKPRAFASNHTHLGRLREAIPAFPNANVKDELVDANSPHRVLSLFFSLRARSIDRHGQSPLCHSVCVATRPRIGDADATPTRRDTTTITPPHTCTRPPFRPSRRIAASVHGRATAKPQNHHHRHRAPWYGAPCSSSPVPTRHRDDARRHPTHTRGRTTISPQHHTTRTRTRTRTRRDGRHVTHHGDERDSRASKRRRATPHRRTTRVDGVRTFGTPMHPKSFTHTWAFKNTYMVFYHILDTTRAL